MDFAAVFKKYKVLIIVIAALVAVAIVVITVVNSIFALRNEGERYENIVIQAHRNSVTSLSACLDEGRVAAQVTEAEFDKVEDILVNVAAARYVDDEGNATSAAGALGDGRLISAIQESYPEIDQRSWQNLQTLVVGCREEFQGTQERVFQEAKILENWRDSDDLFNSWIKSSFPSDNLVITKPSGEKLTGVAALDFITQGVTTEEAQLAFETGTVEEQDLGFGDE